MRTVRTMLLSCAGAMALASLLGTPVADADSTRDIIQELDEDATDAQAIERRLTKVTTILAKADNRLGALETVFIDNPNILPPSLIDNPNILPPLATIQTQAEGFLASVDVIDSGTTADALARRLGRVASTVGGASSRLEAVAIDDPNLLPPSLIDDPNLLPPLATIQTQGETLLASVDALDSGTSAAAFMRRVGRVGSTLAGVTDRLEAVVIDDPNLLPPGLIDDPNLLPALDAIIANATALATAAQAIKDMAPPEPDTPPPTGP